MKLVKYVETQGKKPFNWNRFLAKKRYTEDDLSNAKDLAAKWVTCACGNQCAIIPRSGHEPEDATLSNLGYDFAFNVEDMLKYHDDFRFVIHRAKAIKTLEKIEKRSAILIEQELKKLHS